MSGWWGMKTSPLRQQLIESLTLKGYSPRTIESYLHITRHTLDSVVSPLDAMNLTTPETALD
jgi:hypothetical protein